MKYIHIPPKGSNDAIHKNNASAVKYHSNTITDPMQFNSSHNGGYLLY